MEAVWWDIMLQRYIASTELLHGGSIEVYHLLPGFFPILHGRVKRDDVCGVDVVMSGAFFGFLSWTGRDGEGVEGDIEEVGVSRGDGGDVVVGFEEAHEGVLVVGVHVGDDAEG